MLTTRWALPQSINICVAGHRDPGAAPEEYQPACRLLRTSEGLCTSLGAGVDAEGRADDDPYTALSEIDMPDEQIEAVLSEI